VRKLDLIKAWLLITLLTLSANGAVKANIASGPQNFGLKVHQEKSIAKPLMRQGKSQVSTMAASGIFIEEDKETGLLYAKARYYDPDTAKFLSEDAWEGDNMIAPSLHRYLYGYQNPTVWVDLNGNFPVTQQVRDFFRNQAANQARTSRGLTESLGDGFFSDVGVRSLNAASGIGNALFSVAGEAVNLVDLGLDSGVGSSRILSNTKVGQDSRARVKGTNVHLL
jgi:RHS repeat-associated protein